MIDRILERLVASSEVQLRRGPAWDTTALVLEPHFGEIRWTPPPSFRALAATGITGASRTIASIDARRGFSLLGPDDFTSVNQDFVHMPKGVSRDPGITLSTNHLVGFAEAAGEAVWCFDVTEGGPDGEYPVYYHHQDEPRARVLATGAWETPTTPDFPSFTVWLETMAAALVATDPPRWLEALGSPGLTFVKKRIALA